MPQKPPASLQCTSPFRFPTITSRHSEKIPIGCSAPWTASCPRPFSALARRVHALGGHRLRIADTVGLLNPFETADLFQFLHSGIPDLPLAFHAHNDMGMATANTLAAFKGGAEAADVTVTGIGERAGNAALEQVSVAVPELSIQKNRLYPLCKLVLDAAGTVPPDSFPLIGKNAFRHESGIHVHAMLRTRTAYEPFAAADIGREDSSEFVLGVHSGEAALRHVLAQLNIHPGNEPLGWLMNRIRRQALDTKQPVTPGLLRHLYYE